MVARDLYGKKNSTNGGVSMDIGSQGKEEEKEEGEGVEGEEKERKDAAWVWFPQITARVRVV